MEEDKMKLREFIPHLSQIVGQEDGKSSILEVQNNGRGY